MTDLNTLLEAEHQRLKAKQANLQDQLRQSAEQLALMNSRLEHVRALLGKEHVQEGRGDGPHAPSHHEDDTPRNVYDIAVDILSDRNGVHMHYKELAQEVLTRGGVLNGVSPSATLNAQMVRDPRFVRPTAKGFYALRRDYPTARNVGARRKGSRRESGS